MRLLIGISSRLYMLLFTFISGKVNLRNYRTFVFFLLFFFNLNKESLGFSKNVFKNIFS